MECDDRALVLDDHARDPRSPTRPRAPPGRAPRTAARTRGLDRLRPTKTLDRGSRRSTRRATSTILRAFSSARPVISATFTPRAIRRASGLAFARRDAGVFGVRDDRGERAVEVAEDRQRLVREQRPQGLDVAEFAATAQL